MDRSKFKVLVGDDHLLSLRLITKQLEIMGFTNTVTAANGDEAQKKLEADNFDIVVIDWVMPVKSGLALLEECRKQPRYAKTAFVMLSSEAHEPMIKQAMDAGANAYLVKPVTQGAFEEKMASVTKWLQAQG